jgi:hypothetical protein
MKIEFVDLPTQVRNNFKCGVLVSALHFQANGDILCGLLFAQSNLFRLQMDGNGKVKNIVDEKIESTVEDSDLWGVGHGLRGSSKGNTVFSTWHGGGLISGILKKDLNSQNPTTLLDFLINQNGGLTASGKHSIVEHRQGTYSVRRFKEPGLLWDVALIGDYIFGLPMGAVWREPYLHTEKRETLRRDLGVNFFLNKDLGEEGLFWFVGEDHRVFRLGLTDIKAKPTTLKVTGDLGIEHYKASAFDGWLYCVCDDSKKLVRLRRNPVSAVEEIQTVLSLEPGRDQKIDSLTVSENSEGAQLILAVQTSTGVELQVGELQKEADPEEKGEVPKLVRKGFVENVSGVSSLTCWPGSTSSKTVLFAGVGSWNALAQNKLGAPQLIRIEI